MKFNRWTPIPHVPLTKALYKCFPLTAKRKSIRKAEIASEKLCDDALQRLSPFLLRNPAVDILDLWPGAGLWSSKINQLLKPRRHVLIEPDLSLYKPLLQPLAETNPSYELLSADIHAIADWQSILSKHFPEQGPSNRDDSGILPRNDTLLVLANLPPVGSKKDHYTPARWWSVFMEACMHQTGLHSYGSVRMIASLPISDAQQVVPRTIIERKRPALWTENVALHAFEVAAPRDPSTWTFLKGWDLAADNASRVAQRAAEQGVTTPPGRELPPIPMAPKSPDPGRLPVPYVPRPFTDWHEKVWKKITTGAPGKDGKMNPVQQRGWIQLNKENRDMYYRVRQANGIAEIDELTATLSRTAANTRKTSAALRPILKKIQAAKSRLEQGVSEVHYSVRNEVPVIVDNKRAALQTGDFDDAILHWDRRPFEPLLINPDELYPRETERSILYFEADPNPQAVQKLNQLDPPQRDAPLRLFEALSLTIGTRSLLTVAELLELIFPGRPINEIVKVIPGLAVLAAKTPKPDYDNLPKTMHGSPGAPEPLNPVACYQENLDYDLSDVRVRTLSTSTLWDIFVEYQRKGDTSLSTVQLSRLLGGTLTSFRTGELELRKRYH
ncbi:hypothetical protein BDV32DRAFT_123384 [Aspergillus pseudonomiae]|uniref:Uncharacterized protein n=1 Tax=Aspergillus pseudonomiae TaxID=1506151 RepID=A0A5N7DLR6_9EURO|nr:uncharacterized protein BDV37DRAFT_241296 [Aspergillus pseudonomiae]KAB8260245.1 hypothetical protein BDV32DRAFT_123384 [Aspergillus pseudonomiae]KAE8407245.1 hypothetical protein BDV37DRAFT_241296 [Aspergillus pseudonomiae]